MAEDFYEIADEFNEEDENCEQYVADGKLFTIHNDGISFDGYVDEEDYDERTQEEKEIDECFKDFCIAEEEDAEDLEGEKFSLTSDIRRFKEARGKENVYAVLLAILNIRGCIHEELVKCYVNQLPTFTPKQREKKDILEISLKCSCCTDHAGYVKGEEHQCPCTCHQEIDSELQWFLKK